MKTRTNRKINVGKRNLKNTTSIYKKTKTISLISPVPQLTRKSPVSIHQFVLVFKRIVQLIQYLIFCSPAAINPGTKQTIDIKIKKKEKTEFKTAPDGRLIITEEQPEKLPISTISDDGMGHFHLQYLKSLRIYVFCIFFSSFPENDSKAGDADNENHLSNMLKDIVVDRKRKMSSKSSQASEPPTKYQGI